MFKLLIIRNLKLVNPAPATGCQWLGVCIALLNPEHRVPYIYIPSPSPRHTINELLMIVVQNGKHIIEAVLVPVEWSYATYYFLFYHYCAY